MKKQLTFLLVMMLLNTLTASAQMSKFKALFLFNFAQNIGWPENTESGNFIITIIGDSEIAGELTELSQSRQVGGNRLVVHQAESVNEVVSAHIIYLAPERSNLLASVLAVKENQPVLIVSDLQGLCKEGAGITFIMEDGRLRFEISPPNIESRGLTVSSRLIALGNEVR